MPVMTHPTLDGKVALVSGSGRGIGREIARKLASEGARVVVNDLDAAPAAPTVAELTGYTWDNVVQKMSDEQWEAMLAVHLTAPFRILRAAAGFVREAARREADEGREVFRKVVNVSSTSGVYGNAGQANYAAAKAGINGLTKAMAKEWGRYKVNVNSVAFGLIKTRLTEADAQAGATIDVEGHTIRVGVNPQILKNAEALIPLGRGGLPSEAAGAVYLFCIPESNYVSGQVLVCGGGRP
ncbi:MAG: 3-oxoacyl-ACP reductase [Burkholderiales bacterium PBB5]|nr:MAG: 3-oxoacyl-ACP reductase [Burkholderiales bacterium PBB5]